MSRRRQDYQVAPAPPQQDLHDGAPSMRSSRRRSSLNASVAQAVEREKKTEREGAREAAIEVHQEHAFSPATGTFDPNEAVLSGTLSSEVGDQLVAVALGEEVQAGLTRNEKMWLVVRSFARARRYLLLQSNSRVWGEDGLRHGAWLLCPNLHSGHILAVSDSNGLPHYRAGGDAHCSYRCDSAAGLRRQNKI